MKRILLVGVFILAISALWGQNTSGSLTRLMDKLYESNQFNGSILVAESGRIVMHKAYGWANVQAMDTLSKKDAFHVGEISNQFTAMAIVMLIDNGLLRYEDDISDYLTELPYQGIRVKDLLYHTSGLPDYMILCEKYWLNKDQPMTNEDLLVLFRDREPNLAFQPGERFLYSNTGYAFLATLVERVTRLPFSQFLSERIFLPLEMQQSFLYQLGTVDTFPERVKNYRLAVMKAYQEEKPIYLEGIIGDKGVYASTGDLYKWSQALYTSILVPSERLKEIFTPGKLNDKQNLYYGGGWVVLPTRKIAYHDGAWGGFTSTIVRYPTSRHTIIILSNRSDRVVAIQRIISKILEGRSFHRPWSSMKEAITRQRFKRKFKIKTESKGSTL